MTFGAKSNGPICRIGTFAGAFTPTDTGLAAVIAVVDDDGLAVILIVISSVITDTKGRCVAKVIISLGVNFTGYQCCRPSLPLR